MILEFVVIVFAVFSAVCFSVAIGLLVSSRHGKKKSRKPKHIPVAQELKQDIPTKQDVLPISVTDTLAQLQAFLEHDKKLDG